MYSFRNFIKRSTEKNSIIPFYKPCNRNSKQHKIIRYCNT